MNTISFYMFLSSEERFSGSGSRTPTLTYFICSSKMFEASDPAGFCFELEAFKVLQDTNHHGEQRETPPRCGPAIRSKRVVLWSCSAERLMLLLPTQKTCYIYEPPRRVFIPAFVPHYWSFVWSNLMFFDRRLFCSPRLHLFGQKYRGNSKKIEILLQFKIAIFYVNIL